MGKIIAWLLITVAAAILYRMGGSDKYPSQVRDAGVSFVSIALLWLFWVHFSYMYIICFGLMWGATSSYHLFMKKPVDYNHFYYAWHGLWVGLAMLPLLFAGFHWYMILGRAILMATLMALWYGIAKKNAVWHECGRGAIIAGTIPLLVL